MRQPRAVQALLRLVGGTSVEHISRCSESSFSAAPPLGSTVLSHSMSLTAEGDSPMRTPISASVSPALSRKSLMRDAHVIMGSSLRRAVESCQRPAVTALRDTEGMPRPPDLPKFDSLGPRVRWWREYRGFGRKEFAKLVGMSYSGLADLENDLTKASKKLHLIAAKLRLSAHYIETDRGEPEAEFPQEAPQEAQAWPFEDVPRSKLDKLNMIERKYAETKLQEALADIESERRKSKKTG